MQKRRGGTHVGFILSFVIFVTFLIFLYSMLIEPTKTNQDKQYLLENLRINLIENISSELMVSSINVVNASQGCIKLNNLTSDLGINSKIIVKNESEITQTSYVLTNDLEIVRNNTNDAFFKVYASDRFEGLNNTGQQPCNQKIYEKGLVRVYKYAFEPNIISLINEYNSNYNVLKTKLKVPNGNDFGFSFRYDNGTMIQPKEKIPPVSVYTTEVPIQYFNKNADILLGKLNVKIW